MMGGGRIEQAIDWASVHQVGAHETGEGEQPLDGRLHGIGAAQEQKGDEDNRDLNAHGVFRRAEEMLDLEGLLDPARTARSASGVCRAPCTGSSYAGIWVTTVD